MGQFINIFKDLIICIIMVVQRIEIVDRQAEIEGLFYLLALFFKFLFLPIITGVLVFFIFKNELYGIISAIGVFILVTYRKKIFGEVWGKRVQIIFWLLVLVLLIWQFYPYITQEYKQSNYERLCREECENYNGPLASLPSGYEGYEILDNEIECGCGGLSIYLKK